MDRTKTPAARSKRGPSPERLTWRRIGIFASLIAVVLLGANAFVCATLAHFFDFSRWMEWQLVPAAIALSFIPAMLLGRNHSGIALRTCYNISAAWLGFLNYAVFAAVACWIVDGVVLVFSLPVSRFSIASIFFTLGLFTAIFGLINAAWIRTTRVAVTLPHLPEAWKNRTIALVSDIHLGHVSGPFFLRRILRRLRNLKPDVVLVSGDMFDGTTAGLDRLIGPWTDYTAPLGVYFVTGNHDEFSDRQAYFQAVDGTGVRVLHNERIVVDGLQILGVHDTEATDPEMFRSILRRMEIDRQMPSVLVAHQPAHLRIAAEAGVSLQLSGHTHRGQFWPWTMVVSRIYGRFAYGLSSLDHLQVFTSSGVGTWGPPLRVGTRSEVVLIRLSST
jgi:predicted MPP superfamily phosphohydrolase